MEHFAKFIVWCLVVDGITSVVTTSVIFAPVRMWSFFWKDGAKTWLGKWIHCPQCFGFWTGVLLYLVGFRIMNVEVECKEIQGSLLVFLVAMSKAFSCLAHGAAASSVCWTAHLIRSKMNETLKLLSGVTRVQPCAPETCYQKSVDSFSWVAIAVS